jgi:predicted aspartyl protease
VGHFHVRTRLTGPTGVSEVVDLLVDTGATFIVLPQALADRLMLRPRRICRVEVAGCRQEQWPLADLHISIGELEAPTPCLVSDVGAPLLGAVALESLLLAVDPVRKRLVPTNALAMSSPRPTVTVLA